MTVIIYTDDGFFLNPIEINFDPHLGVGFFSFSKDASNELANRRKLCCMCYKGETFIRRELLITSISLKEGIATFRYTQKHSKEILYYFDGEDVKKLSSNISLPDFLKRTYRAIENEKEPEFIKKLPPEIRGAAFRIYMTLFVFNKLGVEIPTPEELAFLLLERLNE